MKTTNSKTKYKKKDLESIFYIFLLVLAAASGIASVLATAPTIPTTLSPVNNSIYFDTPTLTCSGSTDAESDPINYLFYFPSGNLVQNSTLTTYNFNNTYFIDNFNRADSGTVGNGWTEVNSGGDFSISNNKLFATLTGSGEATLTKNISNVSVVESLSWNWNSTDINGAGNNLVQLYAYDGGTECFNLGLGGATTSQFLLDGSWIGSNISANTDYFMTVQDLDFDSKTFNVYANGILQAGGSLSTCNQFTSLKWRIASNDGGTINSYIDDLEMGKLLSPSVNNWNCQSCDNNSECSSLTSNSTFSMADFYSCSSGNVALNFTLRDEENESALIGDMDGTLTLDSLQDSKAYSFDLNDNSNFGMCLEPSNVNVNVSGFMEYLPNSSSYTYPRQYYFDQNTINGNNTQDISLYSLVDSLSTAVQFTASKAGSLASDILIHLQKYDPATNAFRLVAMGQTSSSGTDIIYLRLTDAWYRILAYDEGELGFTSGPEHITSTNYLMNLIGGTAGENAVIEFGEWLDLGNIIFTLNYSNASQAFQLVADDSSGASTSMCLKVDKHDMLNGTTNICYQCVSSASVSISCAITDTDAYYTAQFIGYTNNTWRVLGSLTQDLSGKIADTIGKDGTFYAFLLVGVSAFAAIWSPAAAITLSLFSVSVMSVLGFIDVAWGMVMLLIVTGIALLTVMYKRRSM
tara:strand:- start:2036 stop:4108 length:2073 start_codon:yes stop_codon:yes gene_type:complete